MRANTLALKLAERAYFCGCLGLGRLLRSARYSRVRVTPRNGALIVRKRRRSFAPILIWLSVPLVKLLDTGVRVLPQRDWEKHERRLYRTLHAASIQIDADGTLVLPWLAGETLACLLEDPELQAALRKQAVERAVVALASFHRLGFTHGDAMAENVLVDLPAGIARWFDFETVHDRRRPMAWRRADDLRALLATCLVRTGPPDLAETLELILDAYADEEITRLVAAGFDSVLRRPLTFHLAQASLSYASFRTIAHLLNERVHKSLEEPL